MEKLTFDNIVGFVLAIAFALVMAISMHALVLGDQLQPGAITGQKAQDNLRIIGYAAGIAALLAWWVQQFASNRSFIIRMLFALFIFIVAFCSLGGFLRVIDSVIRYPNQQDWSFSGLYWASQGNLISFVIDILVPPRAAYAGLMLAAALFLATFGARGPKTIRA